MPGLAVEHVDEVDVVGGLRHPQLDEVRETVGEEPVEGPGPLGKVLLHRVTLAPDHVVAVDARRAGPGLEAGGEDDAVDLVVRARHHDPRGGDPVDPGRRRGQRDIGPVERLQVLVVEAGALAHVAEPRLETVGGRGIRDDRVDPLMGAHEQLHVRELGDQRLVRLREFTDGRVHQGLARQLREQVGPAVVDQVPVHLVPGDDPVEVVVPLVLPTGLERLGPPRVGLAVVARLHDARRALHHDQLLGVLTEVGHHLHAGGAGAHHGDALVAQVLQVPGRRSAGVVVVPAAGVEDLALEVRDPGHLRQLRLGQCAVGAHEDASAEPVAAVGGDLPSLGLLVPLRVGGAGLEVGLVVEVVVPADALGVLEDLGAVGVPLAGDVPGLLEQRHVDVRFDVALDARVAVPVPGTAEVAAVLDDPEVLDAVLREVGTGGQPPEPASQDQGVELLGDRLAGDRVGERIGVVHLEEVLQALELGQLVPAQAGLLVRLETLTEVVGVEIDVEGDLRFGEGEGHAGVLRRRVRPRGGVPWTGCRTNLTLRQVVTSITYTV